MDRKTIPLCAPEIRGNEWEYIKKCLDTNWVSSAGPFVERFEYANLPGYAVVTVDGTAVDVDIYSGVSRKIWRKRTLVG